MFKFTFSISNGAFNPFSAEAENRERAQRTAAPQTIPRKLPAPPKRPIPPPSTSGDVQRPKKRGWEPTSSSTSAPISQPTLTSGWIDTPSRYLEAASQSHSNGGEDDMDADLPPPKRRKTLTDSIISTAFSAALIGTAVGMTAYRMWRDRGKTTADGRSEPTEQPPPPYEREEWVDMAQTTAPIRTTKLPRKPRPTTRRAPRHRKIPIALSPPLSPVRVSLPSKVAAPKPEEHGGEQAELEDQMDWMGDKIRHLIEEGQKALGKEVVIMSDGQGNDEEGAVDDGMDGWEEEDRHAAGPSSLTSSTFHRPRRTPSHPLVINTCASLPTSSDLALPASYGSTPASPRHKRSRGAAGGSRSQVLSPSGSSHLSVPSTPRLGGRTSREDEDFKVIYEPGVYPTNSDLRTGLNGDDEDSRRLTERLENIRKTYKIL